MNLLIWFSFTLLMVIINWQLIEHQIYPSHPLNAIITCALAALFAMIDKRPKWFTVLCALFTYWFAFDTLLNIFRHEPIAYLGTISKVDLISEYLIPYSGPVFWFKLILFLGFTLAYYFNYDKDGNLKY